MGRINDMKKITYILALVLGIIIGWLTDWLFFRKPLQDEAGILRDELQISQNQAKDMQRMVEAHSAEVTILRDKLLAAQDKPISLTPPSGNGHADTIASMGEPDDLARIDGIGPKTKTILYESGVLTFAHLASGTADELAALLKEGGFKGVIHTETWPEQAALAANGDWDKLQALQDQLDSGRRKK